MMMTSQTNIKLYREVNNRVRYYHIVLYKTLFDTYIIEKIFGSVINIKPTGITREYYKIIVQAIEAIKNIASKKLNKGYRHGKKRI